MNDNPFAPAAEPGTFRPASAGDARTIDLAEARRELALHVTDTNALANDRAVAGPKMRPIPLAAAAIGLVALVGGGLGAVSSPGEDAVIIGIIVAVFGGITALIGGIIAGTDARLIDRSVPHEAGDAATSFWRSFIARPGMAWSTLSPTARRLEVRAPDLEPVITTPGTYTLGGLDTYKQWITSFAMQGGGQQRQMRIVTNPVVTRQEGDYAETTTVVEFSSVPMWLMAITLVLFLLIRLLGLLLFLVVQFALRQKRTVTITQQWLRGANGAWYLLDAAIASE